MKGREAKWSLEVAENALAVDEDALRIGSAKRSLWRSTKKARMEIALGLVFRPSFPREMPPLPLSPP